MVNQAASLMARYEITSPDGKRFEITAPEGATQEQVLEYAQQQFSQPAAQAPAQAPVPGSEPLPSFGQRLRDIGMSGVRGLVSGSGSPLAGIMGAAGEGFRQSGEALNRGAYKAGGAVTDVLAPHVPPEVAGGAGYLTNVATQAIPVVVGGMVGPGAQRAVTAPFKAAGRVIRNVADPWTPGGIDRAVARTALQAAGPQTDDVIAALRQAKQIVPGSMPTAGEAAARTGRAEFAGLQKAVEGRLPSDYEKIAKHAEDARRAAIAAIGKDKAALAKAISERANDAAEAYGSIRHLKIDPRSDIEIMKDAIASKAASKGEALRDWGRFSTTEASMTARGENFVPVPGMPRVSARASNFPERAEEAQQAARDAINIVKQRFGEERFLENTMDLLKKTVGLENKNLRIFLTRPSIREAVKDAMKSSQETGAYFPTKAGDKFSIGNLQRIKESMDAGISAAEKATSVGRRPELSSSELQGTRKAFVNWLSNKSPEWQAARHQYLLNSQPINRMQVAQELEKTLKSPLGTTERPAAFASALREAPRTIKRATGAPRFDTLQEVDPQLARTAGNVLEDLQRTAQYEQLAKAGSERARELVGQVTPTLPQVGMFNPKYSVARSISNRLAGRVEGKSLDRLAEVMQNPEQMAELMAKATPAQRAIIVNVLTKGRTGTATGAAIGGAIGYESGQAP